MTDASLEKQYNNRKAVPEFPEYLADWNNRSYVYRENANCVLDVSYGKSGRETLDIFFCDKPDAPLHIFIHGGYWQALSKDTFSFMAEAFNARGENAVILNYDLCPQVSVGAISRQIISAINWLFSGKAPDALNTSHLQITGHSAGGHLAAELLTVQDFSPAVRNLPFERVTSLSGLFDLEPLIETTVNDALKMTREEARRFSPVHRQPANPGPVEFKLIVGALESEEYLRQSELLEQTWAKSGLSIERITAPDTHHFSILDSFIKDYYRPL